MNPRRTIFFIAILVVIAAVGGVLAAKWKTDFWRRTHPTAIDFEEAYARRTAPAPGRAEYVPAAVLLNDPKKYDGRRVVLSGVWKEAFEYSALILSDDQKLSIWVDLDERIEEPMGDLSQPDTTEEPAVKLPRRRRIIAEGTFRYEEHQPEDVDRGGFGHLGGVPGYFRIDRIFRSQILPNPENAASAQPDSELLLNKPGSKDVPR